MKERRKIESFANGHWTQKLGATKTYRVAAKVNGVAEAFNVAQPFEESVLACQPSLLGRPIEVNEWDQIAQAAIRQKVEQGVFDAKLPTETVNLPPVAEPGELNCLVLDAKLPSKKS